ncbi:hypothetical protein J6590_042356 [Homalodisca vitripennis]|nr:hypothetical protein J6590_042356 [Homalodisca vitripennis]
MLSSCTELSIRPTSSLLEVLNMNRGLMLQLVLLNFADDIERGGPDPFLGYAPASVVGTWEQGDNGQRVFVAPTAKPELACFEFSAGVDPGSEFLYNEIGRCPYRPNTPVLFVPSSISVFDQISGRHRPKPNL